MGAFYGNEQNALSSITVAVLEDTGWFIGNYSLTSKSSFGHVAGCDFVNEKCIVDGGELPSYSKGFFCNSPSSFATGGLSLSCTPTHSDIGYCDLFDVYQNDFPITSLPPAKFQYFNDNVSICISHLISFISSNQCTSLTYIFLNCTSHKVIIYNLF